METPKTLGPDAVIRGTGFTPSEKALIRTTEQCFLRMWSYPSPWQDKKANQTAKDQGKELCDLLVIFDEHIIIFSDKNIAFDETETETKTLQVRWKRWYRAAALVIG